MRKSIANAVRRRARDRCEYCHLPQRYANFSLSIDHVLAQKHDGPTTLDNLALSCPHCNTHKGSDLAGLDPKTGLLTPIFHPRRDKWSLHFRWRGVVLIGKTPIGRTTVRVLFINDPKFIAWRLSLQMEGVVFR